MSLINQMLKDLDQRGSGTAENERARGSSIRAVPEQSSSKLVLVIGALLLIVLGAAAGWYFRQQPVAPPAVPASPAQLAKVEPALPPAQTATGESANPASNPAQAAQAPSPDKSVMVKQVRTESSQAGKQALPVATNPSEPTQAGRISTDKPVKSARGGSSSSSGASEARQTRASLAHDTAGKGATAEAGGKEVTTRQQADNAYGKAISLMGNGQRADAIAELENALAMNPKHAMARQTLAGLLLAEKRSEDALKLDRTQWGMAMILARLQVENNDSKTALATLRRSLPQATQKPDYLAFMAALLQREKNHKEAIALYAQALARAPQNGYWWMGYGISLQAENKNADARTAYVNAQKSKNLTPELRAFVEQKLSQLK
jgi:MSHA biogenesis protein MshN